MKKEGSRQGDFSGKEEKGGIEGENDKRAEEERGENAEKLGLETEKNTVSKGRLKVTFLRESAENMLKKLPKIDSQRIKTTIISESKRLQSSLPNISSEQWKQQLEATKAALQQVNLQQLKEKLPIAAAQKLTDSIPKVNAEQIKTAFEKMEGSAIKAAAMGGNKAKETVVWASSSLAAAFRRKRGQKAAEMEGEKVEDSGKKEEISSEKAEIEAETKAKNEYTANEDYGFTLKERAESIQPSSDITPNVQISDDNSKAEPATNQQQTSPNTENSAPPQAYPSHLSGLISERSDRLSQDLEKMFQSIKEISFFKTDESSKAKELEADGDVTAPASPMPSIETPKQRNTPPKQAPEKTSWSLPKLNYHDFIHQLSQPSFIQQVIGNSAKPLVLIPSSDSASSFFEKCKSTYSSQRKRVVSAFSSDYLRWSYWASGTKSAYKCSVSAVQDGFRWSNKAIFSSVSKVKQSVLRQFHEKITLRLFSWFILRKTKFLTLAGAAIFLYGLGHSMPPAIANYYLESQKLANDNRVQEVYTELLVCRLGVEGWKKKQDWETRIEKTYKGILRRGKETKYWFETDAWGER